MSPDNPLRDGVPETCFNGKVFRITREPIRYADGRRSTYEVVRHLGAVAILPILLDPLRVVLIHQYRHPVGERIWEIPAGTLDVDGESPEDCARRELIEETGYQADQWLRIADFFTAPGFCDEQIALFAAWRLAPVPESPEPDEVLSVHPLPWDEILRMLQDGEICDGKTLIGLRWLQQAVQAGEIR